MVVSTPAATKIGTSWLLNPSSTALCPSSVPPSANVSRPASGPLKAPWNRLNPTLWFTPNSSSPSYENEPW